MAEYYTRREAAVILSVSESTVSKYIKQGLLRNKGVQKILIPCDDIHHFYENNHNLSTVSKAEFIHLEKKVNILVSEIEILKMVLGVGTPRPARTDSQLILLYNEISRKLATQSWEPKDILSIADIMISIRDTEVARMLHLKGTKAWTYLFDLVSRMLYFVENTETIPRESAQLISSKIEAGKNRLYGLVFVSLQTNSGIEKSWAKRLLANKKAEKSIDEFVISYIKSRR